MTDIPALVEALRSASERIPKRNVQALNLVILLSEAAAALTEQQQNEPTHVRIYREQLEATEAQVAELTKEVDKYKTLFEAANQAAGAHHDLDSGVQVGRQAETPE